MASQEYVKLAQSLPPRLLRFFARFPPPPSHRPTSSPPTTLLTTTLLTTTSPPANPPETSLPPPQPRPYPNPFQPQKQSANGRWRSPVFSLRRQADLVKMARDNGVEELLPYTSKGTEVRLRKRMEHGLRVKGTGVGQKVKGKKWERTMKGRLEKRRVAMLGMPQLVQQWKQLGHGRGWKKWPR